MEKELANYIKKIAGIPKDPAKKFDCKLDDPEPEKELKAYIERIKAFLRP